MTLEDSLRDTLSAKVADPPDLPGLYGKVAAQAVEVRRRRRVAAAIGSSLAVVAIAVPVAFTLGGGSQPSPGAPTTDPTPRTTAHALPTTPAVLPSATVTSSASPTGPADVSGSAVVTSPPAPPEAPTISLPVGGAYTAPVMSLDGTELSLLDKGSSYALGSHGTGLGQPVGTTYGILLPGPHAVYLVDSKHQLITLPGSGSAFACGMALSHDGRFVAWGTQGGPGGTAGGEPTLKGTYVLYDLQARKVVHRYAANAQGCPVAYTTDGRLLMSMGDGAATDAGFWNPAAGTVTSVGKGVTVTIWTSRTHAQTVKVRLDGDGFCGYYQPGATGGKAYLGDCGSHLGSATAQQERISTALNHDHLALSDLTSLDATHVGVIASAQRTSGHFTFTFSWILTCTVPTTGSVSCVQNQQLAPQWSARSGPDADQQLGPQFFLVR